MLTKAARAVKAVAESYAYVELMCVFGPAVVSFPNTSFSASPYLEITTSTKPAFHEQKILTGQLPAQREVMPM